MSQKVQYYVDLFDIIQQNKKIPNIEPHDLAFGYKGMDISNDNFINYINQILANFITQLVNNSNIYAKSNIKNMSDWINMGDTIDELYHTEEEKTQACSHYINKYISQKNRLSDLLINILFNKYTISFINNILNTVCYQYKRGDKVYMNTIINDLLDEMTEPILEFIEKN